MQDPGTAGEEGREVAKLLQTCLGLFFQ